MWAIIYNNQRGGYEATHLLLLENQLKFTDIVFFQPTRYMQFWQSQPPTPFPRWHISRKQMRHLKYVNLAFHSSAVVYYTIVLVLSFPFLIGDRFYFFMSCFYVLLGVSIALFLRTICKINEMVGNCPFRLLWALTMALPFFALLGQIPSRMLNCLIG